MTKSLIQRKKYGEEKFKNKKMKLFIIGLFLASGCFPLKSQVLEKIKKRNEKGDKEIYHVTNENHSIKHGKYIKRWKDGAKINGHYLKNKKDSIWAYYNKFGRLIKEDYYNNNYKDSTLIYMHGRRQLISKKIQYSNNENDSTWFEFDSKNRLLYELNFSKGLVNYNWYEKSSSYLVNVNGKWVNENLDSPPIALNTPTINYPVEAQEKGIQGEVVYSVVINEKGDISNITLVKGIHPLLNKEAYLSITRVSHWYPAIRQGRYVSVLKEIPVNFKLQ